MNQEILVLSRIEETLANAIRIVEQLQPEVPGDLRSTVLVEVFRALREDTATAPVSQPEVLQSAASRPASTVLPAPSLVTSSGSRTQQAIYAAVKLAARGDQATATAIGRYSKDEMASEIKKVSDVLRKATPDLVERSKADKVFVYTPTPKGLRHLTALEQEAE